MSPFVGCLFFTRSLLYVSLPAIIPDQASLKLGTKWRRFSSFLLMCRVTTKMLPNQRSMHSPTHLHICIDMHLICTMSFYSEFHLPIVPVLLLTMHCIEALRVCCWEWLILLQMHIHSHDLMQSALIFDYSPFYHWPSCQPNLFVATTF